MARARLTADGDGLKRRAGGQARAWVNHNCCRLIHQPPSLDLWPISQAAGEVLPRREGQDGGVLQTCKPGSVSFHRWKVVTIYLAQPSALRLAVIRPKAERRYRRGQAANPGTGRAPKSPYLALLQVGFSRRCVTAVGRTLLPSDFTLILPSLEGRYVSVPLSVPDSG